MVIITRGDLPRPATSHTFVISYAGKRIGYSTKPTEAEVRADLRRDNPQHVPALFEVWPISRR